MEMLIILIVVVALLVFMYVKLNKWYTLSTYSYM